MGGDCLFIGSHRSAANLFSLKPQSNNKGDYPHNDTNIEREINRTGGRCRLKIAVPI
jgi:hypothetical protein